jgi:hypothetical protein
MTDISEESNRPLYASKEEALNAPGWIFLHYKKGVYRVLRTRVKHTEREGEFGVFYEHLHPFKNDSSYRPEEIFFGLTEDGQKRFVEVSHRHAKEGEQTTMCGLCGTLA